MSVQIVDSNSGEKNIVAQTEWVEFRGSQIHGMGGYARKRIPNETYIIEYVGEKITKEASALLCDKDNRYIFTYDDDYDLDGSVDWNLARWINHSCEANCETIDDDGKIWIAAMRDIEPDEELTFNYCYDLDDYKAHPCRCGSNQCVGFIVSEEHHDEVRAQAKGGRKNTKSKNRKP